MNTISEIWLKDKSTFNQKSLSQILAFAGDGKLYDNSVTSKEFRDLLQKVPSEMLRQFTNDCLVNSFPDSGFALQDIVNQVGSRLDFDVQHGLYKGRKGSIGFDGIWSKDNYSIVVEVKTTDAYRIELEKIAAYRQQLINNGSINKDASSILIVVGRNDTKDLEAQIRGSRYAWDIRVISTESLLKLLSIKETLNDPSTMIQINEILKPQEYTRLDRLIELMFITSQDVQIEDAEEQSSAANVEENATDKLLNQTQADKPEAPVNFTDICIELVEKKLEDHFVRRNRILFSNEDKSIGICCATSKTHTDKKELYYWFAYRQHQHTFLQNFKKSYVAFGCGNEHKTLLIPFEEFCSFIQKMNTTEQNGRKYWHVIITQKNNRLYLYQRGEKDIDVTKYVISNQ